MRIFDDLVVGEPSYDGAAGVNQGRAHLLLQADPGTQEMLCSYVEGVRGVDEVASTTGAFDAIDRVEVADERQLQAVLVAARSAPGLARLCLCRTPST